MCVCLVCVCAECVLSVCVLSVCVCVCVFVLGNNSGIQPRAFLDVAVDDCADIRHKVRARSVNGQSRFDRSGGCDEETTSLETNVGSDVDANPIWRGLRDSGSGVADQVAIKGYTAGHSNTEGERADGLGSRRRHLER